jgi:Cu/Ag efflux pump CusA
VVILGGLMTSTILTLFVVPVLYLRFGEGSAHRRVIERPFAVHAG